VFCVNKKNFFVKFYIIISNSGFIKTNTMEQINQDQETMNEMVENITNKVLEVSIDLENDDDALVHNRLNSVESNRKYDQKMRSDDDVILGAHSMQEDREQASSVPAEEKGETLNRTESDKTRTIFIGGVQPYEIDEDLIQKYFLDEHNEKVSVKLIGSGVGRKGFHKGYGFVKFETVEGTQKFLELGKIEIGGKIIDCKEANMDSPRYDFNHHNHHNHHNSYGDGRGGGGAYGGAAYFAGGGGGRGGGRGGRGGYNSTYYRQYGQHNVMIGPDGSMMFVQPDASYLQYNNGGVQLPRRHYTNSNMHGTGRYPAQFNQSNMYANNNNNNSNNSNNGETNSQEGNDGIVDDDEVENRKNKNKIPSLDENGFPLPSDNDDNDDEEGEGDGDTSSSRRRNGEPSSQVFVGGLPKTATEDEVAWFFSQYGPVSRVRLIYDKETGASKRYGFVEFVTPEAAAAVQGLKNLQFQNRMIDVNYASRNIGGGSQNYAPRQHHQHMMMMQQMVPPFDAMGNPMYYPPNGMMIPPPYFVDHRHNIDNSYNSYNSVPNPNGGFLPPHGVFRENTTMPTMETVFDSLPSSQQVLSETGLIE
jgi:RNA recognition motif-containing protein